MNLNRRTAAQPNWQIGYLSPLPIIDALHYEFYQICPSEIVFIAHPMPIAEFTATAAKAALAGARDAAKALKERQVDRIVFGGVPPSALVGRQTMLAQMREIEDLVQVRVSSDLEDLIQAASFLSLRKVTLACKWNPEIMAAVSSYFAVAGIEVAGPVGNTRGPVEANALQDDTRRSAELAVELGRKAFDANPEADGLILAGGTWLSLPAIAELEHVCGKPVISNITALSWNALRQFGLSGANGGGRLLEKRAEQQR